MMPRRTVRQTSPAARRSMMAEWPRRVALTLGVLLLVRAGRVVPLPGLDPEVLDRLLPAPYDLLGWFLAGSGAWVRLSVLSLGLTPAITAYALVQLVAALTGRLWPRAVGRVGFSDLILGRWVRGLTLVLALAQGYAVANSLGPLGLVAEPGRSTLLAITLTLAAGALLMAWLAEQISLHGLGTGVLVILSADLVMSTARGLVELVELARQGEAVGGFVPGLIVALIEVVLVVILERARWRVPARQAGGRPGGLLLRLDPVGPVAPLIASTLLSFGVAALAWAGLPAEALGYGRPLNLALSALGIVLAGLAWAARASDPDGTAADLARSGGAIPGVAAGPPTAVRLRAVSGRLAWFGALSIAALCIVPEVVTPLTGPLVVPAGFGIFVLTWTVLDLAERGTALREGGPASAP